MDFKGVTWAGNIYQRFEAMCLEVEEAMYEDTIKYMESQAHKVGGSVKKFYSEMMQDLLPMSCISPEQNVYGDYLLDSYAHGDVTKKPRLSILDTYGQHKKNEVEDIPDFAEEELGRDGVRFSPPPAVYVESIHSDGFPTPSKKLGAYVRPVCIKRVSRSGHPPKQYVPVHDRKCNLDEAEKRPAPTSVSAFEATVSTKLASTNITRKQKGIVECIPVASERAGPTKTPTHTEAGDSECMASSKSLAEQPNAVSTEQHEDRINSPETMLSTSTDEKPNRDGSWFEPHPDTRIGSWNPEPVAEELISRYKDNLDVEAIEESELVSEPLEETCILVDAVDATINAAPQGTDKAKPYKKKIREALASKLRLKKKQPQMVEDVNWKSSGGSSESDWELL